MICVSCMGYHFWVGYTFNFIALFHIDNSSASVHGAETLLSPACFILVGCAEEGKRAIFLMFYLEFIASKET